MGDTAWVAAITALITGPIIAVLTWLSKSGVDAWIKTRKQHMDERVYFDQQSVSSHEVLIQKLTEDLREVRAALVNVQQEHLVCIERTGILQGKCDALQTLMESRNEQIKKMERDIDGLREWRHKLAGEEHVGVLHKAIDEKLSELK